ncbi:hypothetical protein Tco_0409844 [Tanacetum coccineum]
MAELTVCCSGCIYISTVASSTVILSSKCLQFEHSAFLDKLELMKILENKLESMKILKNKLESMKILENKLESLKLQENQPVDGLVYTILAELHLRLHKDTQKLRMAPSSP